MKCSFLTTTTLWGLELCDFYGVIVLRFYDEGGIENIHQSLANSFKTFFYTVTYFYKNKIKFINVCKIKKCHRQGNFWTNLPLTRWVLIFLCGSKSTYTISFALFEHTCIIFITFFMGVFYFIKWNKCLNFKAQRRQVWLTLPVVTWRTSQNSVFHFLFISYLVGGIL